jgi:hypothetical protein
MQIEPLVSEIRLLGSVVSNRPGSSNPNFSVHDDILPSLSTGKAYECEISE